MKSLTLLAFLSLISCFCGAEKIRDSEWNTGILIDQSSERHSHAVGTMNNGHATYVQKERILTYFRVDAGNIVYTFSREQRSRDKQLDLTVNTPVKFAIKGSKVYILDEEGKQHELRFEEKELKKPAENGSQPKQ